ncbi:MAG TPA: hypothetical protein VNA23_09060, partial [Anaerolineales bacterium]|nr:hypothetical protein [Anaerolineales bacterium]
MRRTLTLLISISLFLVGCRAQSPSTPELATAVTVATATITSLPTPTTFPTPTLISTPLPDTLYVDAAKSLGTISPLVYGSNYGPWLVAS